MSPIPAVTLAGRLRRTCPNRQAKHRPRGMSIGTRLIALLVAAIATAIAQTTQGLILGRVLDTQAGRPVELATIRCRNTGTDSTTTARSDKEGFFVLPLLSPGPYQIRVEAEQYQAQEVDDLELPVAGRLELICACGRSTSLGSRTVRRSLPATRHWSPSMALT